MKRILPVFFAILIILLIVPALVSAQIATDTPVPQNTLVPTPVPTDVTGTYPITSPTIPDDTWIVDPEVTFAGKNAARSGLLLDWTLKDYKWATAPAGMPNPIEPFYALIRNIIYLFLLLFVMVTAFILIATRGRSISVNKFLPRFIFIIILITLAFGITTSIYGVFDAVQGFFLRADMSKECPPTCISQKDLLYVGWSYAPFFGLRKTGDMNTESAFISLLFVKLTALTYYAMVIILIVRKIILWFFIIVSPVFPLLLFYYPLRNTAKIWIGEYFRWLLYGPLFSIFLAGLVALWRTRIPMQFNTGNREIIFPTSINIMLGGPGQLVEINNSINNPDTFALYLVALIMLWMVILVPWILLRIFLDHAMSYLTSDNPVFQQMTNIIRRTPPSPTPATPVPVQPAGSGLALPFKQFNVPKIPYGAGEAMKIPVGEAMAIPKVQEIETIQQSRQSLIQRNLINTEILNTANLSVPTMRDIARYETALRSSTKSSVVKQTNDRLVQIANPSIITNTIDREKINNIREKIVQNSRQGNELASQILKASQVAAQIITPQQITKNISQAIIQIIKPETVVSSTEKESYKEMHDMVVKESEKGNKTATTILSVNEKTTEKELLSIQETLFKESQQGDKFASIVLTTTIGKESNKELYETLKEIANPQLSKTVSEKEKISAIHDSLIKESEKGEVLAKEVLKTDETTNIEKIKEKLILAALKGGDSALHILQMFNSRPDVKAQTNAGIDIPRSNRIQTVSLEDYEAVKKIWQENYKDQELPQGMDRKNWIEQDLQQIDEIINLLSAQDQQKVQEGMQQVGNILPFLLLGGFSQEEIITYLKAKKEAGKSVLEVLKKEETDEETMLEVKKRTATNEATMSQKAEVTEDSHNDTKKEEITEDSSKENKQETEQDKKNTDTDKQDNKEEQKEN